MVDTGEVFDLRREGRLEEALKKGRKCYDRNPDDNWSMRALGWTLYDLMKQALNEGNTSDARAYLEEFDKMNVPEKDNDLIHEQVDRLRRQIKSPEVRKAEEAGQKENYKKAVDLFREARAKVSVDDGFKRQNAWALRNRIRELTQRERPPIGVLHRLFVEFAELDPPPDDKLYSAILFDAVKIAEKWKSFNRFLHWWNVDLFGGEHFQPFRRNGETYPSLACRAARAAAKRALTDGDEEAADWILPLLQEVLKQGTEDELWIRYDIGRLASLVGDRKTARQHLRQVIRAKYTESWAWRYFAETFEDTYDRKAALCVALDGAPKDSFGLTIRENLAALLIAEEEYPQAKREILNIVEIREKEGYDIPNQVDQWQSDGWFDETAAAESNQAYYESHADHARDLVLEDIPWQEALMTGHQPKSDKGPARTFIGIKADSGRLEDIPARDRDFSALGDLEEGTPLEVRASASNGTIYDLRRRDAEKWDLLEQDVAVVDHVNRQSDVTHVVISRTRHALAYHDQIPVSVDCSPGECLKIRTVVESQNRPERVVTAEPTTEPPPSSIKCSFSGTFNFPPSGKRHFGFVQDYYVSKELIKTHGLSDGEKISGEAILSQPDDNKWKVVHIETQKT